MSTVLLSALGSATGQQPELAWIQTILLLVLAVALTVVSELLRPKPDIEDARPAGLGDFDFPTATEGRAIPVVFGSVKIAGPNVIWYGDLLVTPIKDRIKSGLFSVTRVTVGFRYRLGIQFAICHGVIDELYRIEADEKIIFPLGAQSPLTSTTKGVVIDQSSIFGGDDERGGIEGEFEWYAGTADISDANVSQYLADQIAGGVLDDTPAFVNVAHLVWLGPSTGRIVGEYVEAPSANYPTGRTIYERRPDGYLGTQSRIEPWVFYVRRFPAQLGVPAGKERVGDDANLMCVLYELLTDDVWGLGIDPADIDVAAFQYAGATLYDEGNGFSMVWSSQRSARDLANEILRQADAVLTQTAAGKYTVVLARTPTQQQLDDALVLDESNVIHVKEFTRSAWNQTFNHVQVNFKDRDDDFKDTSAVEQDLANFLLQGQRDAVAASDWPGIKEGSTAQQVARRELRQLSYPLAKLELECNRTVSGLLPGHIAKFSWAEYGITDMILRVGKLDLGDLDDGKVVLTAVEDVYGLGNGGFSIPPATDWSAPQTSPVDAAVQAVFPMAGIIAQKDGANPLGDSRLMAVVPRTQGAATGVKPLWNFGNPATEWGPYGAGPADGEPSGFSPTCELSADLPARQDGLPVTTSIDLENATADFVEKILKFVEPQDSSGLAAGRNLVMVGGEGGYTALDPVEFMSFESLTDNQDGTYTLNNVQRGLGDTVPVDHPAGRRVYFLDAEEASFLSDFNTLWPGWDGGSQSTDVLTDTRIQVITPFGELNPADASQQLTTFEAQQNLRDKAARIFMPLPPFDVVLKMDPQPTTAATPYYLPGPPDSGLVGSITRAQVSGLTAALNCRLEWKARARNSSTIKLPGDSTDTLDATSEPGEYPVDSPNPATAWELLINVRGESGGSSLITSTTINENTGAWDFTIPATPTQNSTLIHITLEARRTDTTPLVFSRTFYSIWFERV